jgi:hypothetical protein
MASIINATSGGSGGLITSGDTSGTLQIQTGGTTAISVSAAQAVAFSGPVSFAVSPTGILPAGTIIQIVQSSTTTSTTTASLSDVTTTLTGSITPSSATSKILVQVNVGFILSNQATAAGYATFSLYRGASSIVSPWFGGPRLPGTNQSIYGTPAGSYLDSPNSTSAVTYTLFFNTNNVTTPQTVQASNFPSFMTLYEIKQ